MISDMIELPALRVEISTVEDARRVVFSVLSSSGLSPAKQRSVANAVTGRLRESRLLASSVEQLYKASEVAVLVSRSPEHVVKEAKAGRFGAVFFDAGGWLIPASGVQAWLDARLFTPAVHEEVAA